MASRNTEVPKDPREMADWFAEAVRVELAELEKKGGQQKYELHTGRRSGPKESRYTIYSFLLADSERVPEDANGTLDVEGRQFKAVVVGQQSNRIDLQLDAVDELGEIVHRAILCVDDLGLLRKLADVLDAIADGKETASALTAEIFHPRADHVRKGRLPNIPALEKVKGEQLNVLEQASSSEITYVWGPPGTGKTYLIAHLLATLIERGERVLITSHTHAALDQLIYETVKSEERTPAEPKGPLANTTLERDGKIVRIGRVTNKRVPETVRLDNIVERRAKSIHSEITNLHSLTEPLNSEHTRLKVQLEQWELLDELHHRSLEIERALKEATSIANARVKQRSDSAEQVEQCKEILDRARAAWLFREKKCQVAIENLTAAQAALSAASASVNIAFENGRAAKQAAVSLRVEINKQNERCQGLPAAKSLRQELSQVEAKLGNIQQQVTTLRLKLNAVEKEVLSEARIVAATLTKCYVGEQLKDQAFDAVIIDEISMALPPLLFLAGRRAIRRIILVGDFKQLPPIVRSDGDISEARLRLDAFRLSGMANDDLEPTGHTAMACLRTQRRMLPEIANVARHISYDNVLIDHEQVFRRKTEPWLQFLPTNPLLIVDTADVHAWCGRQPGSLSRFNLYSAQLSVELAAMAAARISEQEESEPQKIGIVTPYAAQRRLLSRLIEARDLSGRVAVGTVHTFQGGEAELIIFDSVLDEPYWTARLCNPNESNEVSRDLNVAVTRAKTKFLFVGSSEWLNRHAKISSGLGKLWHYLKDNADLVSALDLVDVGFAGRVAEASATYHGRGNTNVSASSILGEEAFYDHFLRDIENAKRSIFGLVPFFGEYRWPKVEPYFRHALERGIEVTLVTPPTTEAKNRLYVDKAIHSLRALGAVVVTATGLHGKDVVIDERIHYTGSLNWASHRGRQEIMHRTESAEFAREVLEYLQARHIRSAAGRARSCPRCHGPIQVVNQSRSMASWDKQPMKIGCASFHETGCKYLVDIDQRAPFSQAPLCEVDGRTKYRRVKRGRGESWECPKHPKTCQRFKVVLGDS